MIPRDVRRQLEYARALTGPTRTEASINSELDRPREERATHVEGDAPPQLQVKRALAAAISVLEYLVDAVETAQRWAPAAALGALLVVAGVSLAVGASLGASYAVFELQKKEELP